MQHCHVFDNDCHKKIRHVFLGIMKKFLFAFVKKNFVIVTLSNCIRKYRARAIKAKKYILILIPRELDHRVIHSTRTSGLIFWQWPHKGRYGPLFSYRGKCICQPQWSWARHIWYKIPAYCWHVVIRDFASKTEERPKQKQNYREKELQIWWPFWQLTYQSQSEVVKV